MMAWSDTKARMTDAIIRTFQETVTYTPKGGDPVEIETEFRARGHQLKFDSDGAPVEGVKPRLLIKYSLIPDTLAVRPKKGDTFEAGGSSYRVAEVEDSGRGYWMCWGAEIL